MYKDMLPSKRQALIASETRALKFARKELSKIKEGTTEFHFWSSKLNAAKTNLTILRRGV